MRLARELFYMSRESFHKLFTDSFVLEVLRRSWCHRWVFLFLIEMWCAEMSSTSEKILFLIIASLC